MKQRGTSHVMCAAASGLCGMGLMSAAFALPPVARGALLVPTTDSANSVLSVTRSAVLQRITSAAPLDLRPLGNWSPPAVRDGASLEPFPSAIRHPDRALSGQDDGAPGSALGIGAAHFQSMSPAEMYVRRVHQEGLPVARLWRSRSAAISIGFNQSGKKGLWLTQKVH